METLWNLQQQWELLITTVKKWHGIHSVPQYNKTPVVSLYCFPAPRCCYWTCAVVFLQVSVRYDRKHSSAVRKRLEGLVGLCVQPEFASARPLRHTPAGRSVSVLPLDFTVSVVKKKMLRLLHVKLMLSILYCVWKNVKLVKASCLRFLTGLFLKAVEFPEMWLNHHHSTDRSP